jgi:hAT family C-terminal dimerisation region
MLHQVRQGELTSAIKTQWHAHVHLHAVICTAFFSCDATYYKFDSNDRNAAMDWFFDWGKKFLSYYNLSISDDISVIGSALSKQYTEFKNRETETNTFTTFNDRCDTMSGGTGRGRRVVRQVWGLYSDVAEELTACVQALLTLTASEAAVERSFSRQGLVHSKLRNRLSDESVQLQMSFAFNTRALEREFDADEKGWEDLADEEDASESRGTALLSQYRRDVEIMAVTEEDEKRMVGAEEGEQAEDVQEVVVEEEEKREEEKRQEENEEQKEPMTLDKFVKKYIADKHIVRGYRFTGSREQQLQSALMKAGVGDMVQVVVKRIKEHLG